MGYNNTAATVSITAKLTPLGRELMVSTNNALITSFRLGDSDANYNATLPLITGQVPSDSGTIGPDATVSNSTPSNVSIKSTLIVSGNGVVSKPVESQSITIISEQNLNGVTTVSGSNLSQVVINRSDYITNSLVNLFYSFGLSLDSTSDINYTGVTYADGGFSDSAFSGFAKSKVVSFAINNSQYGEMIDGKSIKFILPTTGGTYTIYSSFQNKGATLQSEDGNYSDTSNLTTQFGDNIAFLFSDTILRPNGGDSTLSWATGYNTVKPFSLNQKSLYNFQTDSNVALTADTIVGIAYLDKGFLVITDDTIISNYGAVNPTGTTTGATVTFDSVSTSVYQNITCIAARGEFGSTTNPTFTGIENPRISEIGLYDSLGNLIALGKTDRHIEKNINEFLALGVKISL
jgi:hypothetical protein